LHDIEIYGYMNKILKVKDFTTLLTETPLGYFKSLPLKPTHRINKKIGNKKPIACQLFFM